MVVAFARGAAGVDPIAGALLPRAWARALGGMQGSAGAALARLASVCSAGMVDHLALRTNAIDAALRTWMADTHASAPQLVLLGAGLDARAHRVPELARAVVFEVDHPATQAFKRPRAAHQPLLARALHYVSTDFEQGALDAALAAAGHRRELPTFWIWEGVTMYLPPAAVRATLADIAARSCTRSSIAVTYLQPRVTPWGATAAAIGRASVAVIGEPLRGMFTREAMAGVLADAGFAVVADTDARAWARAHAASAQGYEPWAWLGAVLDERLALAARI